jgi:ERCC4-type nuclease
MISKFLGRLKSILFKSAVSSETPLKKEKKPTKSAKSSKTKTKTKTKAKTKAKTKTVNSKKNIEILTALPGVGAKSAKALFDAGFKTPQAIIDADEKDLLEVSGVGINLVKKIKKLK